MTQEEDITQLEELLTRVVPHLAREEELAVADVPEQPVAPEVRAAVLAKAETHTGELLAAAIIDAANRNGKTRDDLVEAAGGNEPDAYAVLDGRGDPRKLGKRGFARLLVTAGANGNALRDLIAQTVAQFVLIYPPRKRNLLRSLAGRGSGEPTANHPHHDAAVGRAAGIAFADEVISEWAELEHDKG